MKRILLFFIFTFCFLDAQFIKEPIFNEATYVKTFGNPKNEAIVFVHGLGDEASDIWKTSVEALKDEYFIMIFDLPGFGKSDKSNQLYSPSKYANFINTLVDNFVDKPFHLIGHSMGASISLLYASLYDLRVKSLTLIDAAAILEKTTYSEFLLKNKIKNKGVSTVISSFSEVIDGILPFELDSILDKRITRKFLLRSNPNTIAAMALVNEDFSSIPRRLQVPTLIIWGEQDKIAPLRTGQVLHYLLAKSKLEVFKNSAHVPMITQFEKYITLLKKHLIINDYKKVSKKVFIKEQSKIIKKEKNKILSGYFKRLFIKDSKNIVIKNAKIEEFISINSEIKVLNSEFILNKKTVIKESNLQISASNMKTIKEIEVFDSNIDLAGVNIKTQRKLFKNISEQSKTRVIYSLCLLNDNNIHGTKYE